MDRHNMKNIQLHYIQLTIILNKKIAFLFKKRQNIFFNKNIHNCRGGKEEGSWIYTTCTGKMAFIHQNSQRLPEISANVITRDPNKN